MGSCPEGQIASPMGGCRDVIPKSKMAKLKKGGPAIQRPVRNLQARGGGQPKRTTRPVPRGRGRKMDRGGSTCPGRICEYDEDCGPGCFCGTQGPNQGRGGCNSGERCGWCEGKGPSTQQQHTRQRGGRIKTQRRGRQMKHGGFSGGRRKLAHGGGTSGQSTSCSMWTGKYDCEQGSCTWDYNDNYCR
tara:strand:+ start:207 stop:770 length:564 start_codon:yes stop_codon:yes gene_type:complete